MAPRSLIARCPVQQYGCAVIARGVKGLDSLDRRAVSIIVALAVCLVAIVDSRTKDALIFSPDDAYITLHNALALKAGHDPSFIGVSPLYGATSLLHLVVETLLLFAFPPLWTAWIASWVGIMMYGLGLVRLAFAMKLGAFRAILVTFLGMTAGLAPLQMLNGLETGAGMAIVVWCLAIAMDAHAPRWHLPVACAIAPLLRPELVALSGILLADRSWNIAFRDGARSGVHSVACDAKYFIPTLAPWLLFAFVASGHVLPSTITTKRDFFCDPCAPFDMRRGWFEYGLGTYLAAIGILSFAYLALPFTKVGRASAFFIAVFLGAYWLEFPGGISHYECRYLYVCLPIAIYALCTVLATPRAWIRWISGVALVGAALQSAVGLPEHLAYMHATRVYTSRELMPVADWARANIPPTAHVLIHDAGYISYGTSLHLYDMVGLKSPEAAKLHREITWPSCGRDRPQAFQEFAREVGATHLIASRGWGPIFGFERALRDGGWGLVRLRSAEDGSMGYDVFALTPPQSNP